MINKYIAFINASDSWGGLEMNVVRLAYWLKKAGYNTIVLCKENTPIEQEAKNKNIEIEYIKKHRKYYDIKQAFNLYKIIKRKNIKYIFAFDNKELSLCALAKLFSKNKLKFIFQQNMLIAGKKKDIFHHIRYKFIDTWIAPLNILKKQVLEKTTIPESKIKVIPLCVDYSNILTSKISKAEACKKLNINPDAAIIGIVGRIDKLKGQHFLIEAVHKLRQSSFNIELLIAGEPTREPEGKHYYKYILELVKKYNLEHYIHFTPYTSTIGEIYSAIDIFTLASKNETFGMVTIEAMGMAKTIIATNTGGTPELLNYGEYGLLYQPENLDDYLNKIKILLNNKDLKEELSTKAQKAALEKYDYKFEVKEIEKILIELNK